MNKRKNHSSRVSNFYLNVPEDIKNIFQQEGISDFKESTLFLSEIATFGEKCRMYRIFRSICVEILKEQKNYSVRNVLFYTFRALSNSGLPLTDLLVIIKKFEKSSFDLLYSIIRVAYNQEESSKRRPIPSDLIIEVCLREWIVDRIYFRISKDQCLYFFQAQTNKKYCVCKELIQAFQSDMHKRGILCSEKQVLNAIIAIALSYKNSSSYLNAIINH
jgi:hypothetical protein